MVHVCQLAGHVPPGFEHTVDFTSSPYDTTSYDTNINVFLRFKTSSHVYDQQDFTILRTNTNSGIIGGSVGIM